MDSVSARAGIQISLDDKELHVSSVQNTHAHRPGVLLPTALAINWTDLGPLDQYSIMIDGNATDIVGNDTSRVVTNKCPSLGSSASVYSNHNITVRGVHRGIPICKSATYNGTSSSISINLKG